ncbi:MAG: SpoIIE family protein phosphatase [Muribaculaceae bacterium]|nr:SpoIIE family protein phosphatase [Roseburia sp.]MCM1431408.1 SpoIIE family protein phosphatase [Muribaculaceae bacterium]MCM1491850.1 SpoIIE family protein phosphatase [Muribaculaceae bacterium]
MNTKRNWTEILGKGVYALLGAMSSLLCVMGCYPLVPAFYAACCLQRRRSVFLYIGMFAGMGLCMPVSAAVKYLFIILVVSVGIRFYLWANRRCSGWMAGMIAGLSVVAMNCSGMALTRMDRNELILGVSEGVVVFGTTVLFYYVLQMLTELGRNFADSRDGEQAPQQEFYDRGRMSAFAEAVDELSAVFSSMGRKQELTGHESVSALEREITGKLCAACDGCALCWEQPGSNLSDKIQRMLQAVIAHRPKEDILRQNYMEECPRYPGMVEEAIWAFSRMELNEAWYRRLQNNRRLIADQLDAMADLMQDWTKKRRCLDGTNRMLLARIGFEAGERGLIAEHVHIYEDEGGHMLITAQVSGKWGGGIPSKNYVRALEKASGMRLRLEKGARSILTKEPVAVTVYEDSRYYAMSGVSGQKQDGASVSGDNFSLFTLENGQYEICLSDGMGSGPAAAKESELVVELMEKFMEAGFSQETAIRMMNSAMVMQGEDDSFSTMDLAAIDLHTGSLTLTKVGAAASFLRSGGETECLSCPSLPAGSVAQTAPPMERHMKNGDFLVMVTDGVLEYLHVKNPEEKLADIISEVQTENAGAMAKAILERVMLFTGGHALDDMTVIVTCLWEQE